MLRTHTCGQLGDAQVGETVTLCGWVDSYRDHGGGLFVDLRDRYGLTQVVFNPPDTPTATIEASKALRSEYVIKVTGNVAQRPEGMANPKMATGKIEVRVTDLEVLNQSLTPPVSPNQQETPNEDLRLKHRYLDLRRPEMLQTMVLRDGIIKSMRDYFADHGFHRHRNTNPGPQYARGCTGTIWCRAACTRARFTRCRNRRSSTSRF